VNVVADRLLLHDRFSLSLIHVVSAARALLWGVGLR
jgi:hypothetical protein